METVVFEKMDSDKFVNILINGGIVAFPTDTVYGLAGINKLDVIKKIYEIKGRDFSKPLPLMCNSVKMLMEYAVVDENAQRVISKYLPGALTVVLKKKDNLVSYLNAEDNTIAIRIPNHEGILNLISKLNQPLFVTSANFSNYPSEYKWERVYDLFKGLISGLVSEDAKGATASTIISLVDDIKLLREGPISFEELKETYYGKRTNICYRT